MNKEKTLFFVGLIFFFTPLLIFSQEYLMSGIIRDARTKELLLSATISVSALSIGTITNKDGYYSLKLPKGNHTIKILSYGYKTKEETIDVYDNFIHHIELNELVYEKEAIIVIDRKLDGNVKSTSIGTTTLTMEQLKLMPSAFSEVDLVRSFLITPGVSTPNDFVTGLNIRGGSSDQNLILLDGMTLFNPFHFLGLYSSFNADAIKSATLYKTNLPIDFSGRASAAIDILQKSGSNDKYSFTAYVSVIDAKIMIEGPLDSTKGSFMIAARRSYFDLYLNALKSSFPSFFNGSVSLSISNLYFYDINAKLSYSIDKSNDISISYYMGKDVVSYSKDLYNDQTETSSNDKKYGNIAASMNWRHIFSEGFYSNLLLTGTYYSNDIKTSNEQRLNKYSTTTAKIISTDTIAQSYGFLQEIINIGLKYNMTYLVNNDVTFKFGVEGTGFALFPGITTASNKFPGESITTTKRQFQNRYYTEWSAYFGVEQNITKNIRLDYGIRGNAYFGLGPLTVTNYKNNAPVVYDGTTGFPTSGAVESQTVYNTLEMTSYYLGIEPRISGRYLIDEETSIKAGYSWLRQNVQLTTTFSVLDFPIDTWFISDKYLKPQMSHNFTLGVYRNFLDNEIEISIEGYFRLLQNLNDYIEGFNPVLAKSTNEEMFLYQADGRAYGVEIYIIKNKGNRNHWTDNIVGTISYTFSKTERKYPEQLQNAIAIPIPEYYALGYDKSHIFNLTLSYKLDDWVFGLAFTYQTNIPKTLPTTQYMDNSYSFNSYYGYSLNSYRLSDYHRLDISARKNFKIQIPSISRTFDLAVIMSIFNLYNRVNTIFGSFSRNNQTNSYEYRESGFVPIVPSIGIEFKL